MIRGSCLCGGVQFEIEGKVSPIGQCHCSLCRKSSGVNGSMVFLVPTQRFRWLQGEDRIKTWKLRDNFSRTASMREV